VDAVRLLSDARARCGVLAQTFKSVARRQIDADYFMGLVQLLLVKYDKEMTAQRAVLAEQTDEEQFRTISRCRV
jgi:hypothetical protein